LLRALPLHEGFLRKLSQTNGLHAIINLPPINAVPALMNWVIGMPFCVKCGKQLETGAKYCLYCGKPVASPFAPSPKVSHGERKFLAAILIVGLLAIGGLLFFVLQPRTPLRVIVPFPTAQNPEPLPTSIPTSPSAPSPSSAQNQTSTNEEGQIRNVLTGYFEAINRHSPENAVTFFTDNVDIQINHGKDYNYTGPREGVKSFLSTGFSIAPDATITNLTFSNMNINGNDATVQANYAVSSKLYKLSYSVTEHIELNRENGVWKIAKTDIVF